MRCVFLLSLFAGFVLLEGCSKKNNSSAPAENSHDEQEEEQTNQSPIIESVEDKVTSENSGLTFTLTASDPDEDDLSYSCSADCPEKLSVDSATGKVLWTPTYDQAGEYVPTFSVTDGDLVASTDVKITVNDASRPPVIESVSDLNATETLSLKFQLSAQDPDGDTLTFECSENCPDGLSVSAEGEINWRPSRAQKGTHDNVTFSVSDGSNTVTTSTSIVVSQRTASRLATINASGSTTFRGASKEFKGKIVFWANDGIHGLEPWITDGTGSGTKLLKDINIGTAGSSNGGAKRVVELNNELFFYAENLTDGFELWKTDGTEEGTVQVKDINPGAGDSWPTFLTIFKNKIYFQACTDDEGCELWTSDGTTAGTVLFKDLRPGTDHGSPYMMTVVSDTMFFWGSRPTGDVELWKTDGTDSGTVLVKDIHPGDGFSNSSHLGSYGSENDNQLFSFDDKLFFTANDGTNGKEIWVSDGTESGTTLFKDINASGDAITWGYMESLNSKLIFLASDGTYGRELWISDGTSGGTSMLKDINLGSADSNSGPLVRLAEELYFSANNGTSGTELWYTDGSAAGTQMAFEINPDGNGLGLPIAILGEKLLIIGDEGDGSGTQLWIY